MGLSGYLIGGTIRDLVLDRPVKDIDIAVNTSPESFLKKLSWKIAGYSICLDREFLTFRFMPRCQDRTGAEGQGDAEDQPTGQGQASVEVQTGEPGQIMEQEQGRGRGESQIRGHDHLPADHCQYWFDFTPLKGDSIAQDLLKRDFTINAMAVNLKDLLNRDAPLCLIDPIGGIGDLSQRTVRAISEEVFRDDPLRILRAYRLAGQLDFRIEEKTGSLIQRDRDLIKNTAPERIREELFLILSLDRSKTPLELLHQNGLLPILFSPALPGLPEMARSAELPAWAKLPGMAKLPGLTNLPELTELAEPHGEAFPDVPASAWADALEILASVEEIFFSLPIHDPECLRMVQNMLSQTAGHQTTYKPLLKLAAFLSALPHVRNSGQKGDSSQVRTRENWDWLDSFLRWLCLSTPQRKYAIACVQGLQRSWEMIRDCCCTPRYFYRFFRDFGDAGIGALIIGMAYHKTAGRSAADTARHGATGASKGIGKASFETVSAIQGDMSSLFNRMIGFYRDWQKNRLHPIMDGKFLIDYFHLSPGPVIGDILNLLEEARAEGEIQTRDDAIELARQLLQVK